MSNQLSAVASTEFDSQVKHAYQAMGKLRDTVTRRTGVVGDTYKFRKMGAGVASQRVTTQVDVTAMNVAHANITATLTNWVAAEYTDIFDAAEVNFDEQRELATTIGRAMSRREDQLIIDALDAASTTYTVANSIGGTNSGLNMAKLRKAKRLLDDNGVEPGQRYYACSATGMNDQLLGTTEATSADYNTVRALVQGEVNSFVGFQFKMIESRTEGGLTLSTNDRQNFAWCKDAVGLAVGIEIGTEVNYIPEKMSWLSAGKFKAGATYRDLLGIVEITTYE